MIGAVVLASWLAQVADPRYAAPEPPGSPPPRAPVDDLPVDASNALAIAGQLAYRLPGASPMVGPAAGYSVGASFEHRYGNVTPDVDLGVALDLFYDRFSWTVDVPVVNAAGAVIGTNEVDEFLFHTSFALLQTIGAHVGAARLFAGAGGGLSIGVLGNDHAFQPIVRACGGVDVQLRGRVGLVVRADYTYPLTHPDFGSSQPFGDQFDVGAGAIYRF